MLKETVAAIAGILIAGVAAPQDYEPVADWLKLPASRETLGNMHGDIAVSAAGDVKMTLDGKVVMTIPATVIPGQYKAENRFSQGVIFTGMDVARNGDLYVTDGYSSSYVHHFDKNGQYLASFGGKEAPYNFNTLHKIAIDERFDPPRIIATDRANNRLVHLSLDGELLGVVAAGLKLPAAVTILGDHAIVGELQGRVSILDRDGRVVATVGANTEEGIGTNRLPPDQWRTGYVLAPHGVATNAEGDLFVAEFSTFGRVHKFERK